LFPTDEAAAEHSAKTFEVDKEYEAVTKEAAAAQQAAASAAATAAAAGGEAKGAPTQEQLIAIKAAIANAAVRFFCMHPDGSLDCRRLIVFQHLVCHIRFFVPADPSVVCMPGIVPNDCMLLLHVCRIRP
jgi:hypothetical protein